MRKKIRHDSNQPIGKLRIISDFLPPPEELAPSEETIKVTLVIDKKSVLFFKNRAKKTGVKYQRMMRHVLKGYAQHYSHNEPRTPA